MKKLIALLAIICLCVMFINAEKVTSPFKFSFENIFKVKTQDDWHPGQMSGNGTPVPAVPVTPAKDAVVQSADVEDTIKLSAKATFAQIYTLSFTLSDACRSTDSQNNGSTTGGVITNSDTLQLNRAWLTAMWGNDFSIIKDMLNLNVSAGWVVSWDNDTAMKLFGGMDRAYGANWYSLYLPQNKMAYEFPVSVGLGGAIAKTGFTWNLNQECRMLFNGQFIKDNDPKAASHPTNGEPYGLSATTSTWANEDGSLSTTGKYKPVTANYADKSFGGFFEAVVLNTNLNLAFEFFHFFAPENITCAIRYDHKLAINAPISYYYEIDKEILNDMQPALEFGLAGPKLYLGARIRHYANYNSSAPVNGSAGSVWLYDGSAIDSTKGQTSKAVNFGGVVFESPSHTPNALKVGPQIGFSVSKDWFEIGGKWNGYAREFWYDWKRDGSINFWRNDFELYSSIKL
jgi:hypothetical protein